MLTLLRRLRILGIVLLAAGLAVAGVGFIYGTASADRGLDSAQAMYEAQGIELSYNDEGRLVDRGSTEGADAIMALLRDEYRYPVDMSNFDSADPLVNTRDELMFQYATITYHVLHGEVDVTLTEEDVPLTFRGVVYREPGVYRIAPLAYYGELDRSHPIEGQLREAWSDRALALNAYLSSGHANQAAGELALMTSLGIGAIGLLFATAGGGLVWASFARAADAGSASPRPSAPAVSPRTLAAPLRPVDPRRRLGPPGAVPGKPR